MMHDDAFLNDVAAYAVGALSSEEAGAMRKHLEQCAICRDEYRALSPAVDAFARTAELASGEDTAASPSPLLKRRLMRAVAAPQPARGWLYGMTAASVAIAIALGTWLALLSADAQRMNREIADLSAPAAQHYHVAHGQVIRAGSHLYIALRGIPAPPPGKVYQAWTLPVRSKRMVPSSTFLPHNGSVLVALPADARTLVAVAMSVEPAGGSRQPTSTPDFVVKLQ